MQLGNDHEKHHSVARAAEKEFGLQPAVKPGQERAHKKRRLSDREIRAMKDRAINREKLEKIMRSAWNACDSGEEMKAMLGALGVELMRGDRRDYVIEYKGLKMNPVRLLEDVSAAQFRNRVKNAQLTKEREEPPAAAAFGRKARGMIRDQVNTTIANDEAAKLAETGFRMKKHKAPAPRLRPRLRFDDPGI